MAPIRGQDRLRAAPRAGRIRRRVTPVAHEDILVLVAAYEDQDAARHDFDALAAQVKAQQVSLDGAILVAKDADGVATLVDTGNHLGRWGAGWGAGVSTGGAAVTITDR